MLDTGIYVWYYIIAKRLSETSKHYIILMEDLL